MPAALGGPPGIEPLWCTIPVPPLQPLPLPMPSIPASLLLPAGWLAILAGLGFASLPYVLARKLAASWVLSSL